MTVSINGLFGVGKPTLAAELVQALPGTVVADPEDTGSAVRSALRSHRREHRNYERTDSTPTVTS
ncbi:hypothetical protein ACOT81_39350 [Streptomyces sp. WI04-05B]|uniref:Uncharacterized protein n=1 Tax=Streptomyces turgidiscabies (strain Car8) TaxID=698760 RepID=L7F4A7_STRT8|nr:MULTISPECIES: hypothetical protein [Streptomyces]ELP65954.1 hypothetical protein STRTUCAR8_01724 [Streptomyces turgidiscabies Car8]MDX2548196.1 hypothetical protein [Streptomyces sp. WI04-05B]MDX2590233.1 hypothetical protein [Streptomyces sp. WI04-05A]MDX3499985.1 hypothetical protein [Streptomyces turgidiscabies]GAQ77396.1 hypothetical protein T45_09214 [Streptomyces turgidiscabies]